MSLTPEEVAYLAGVVDGRGRISAVRVNGEGGALLPRVGLSAPDPRLAAMLGTVSGIKPIVVTRNYDRAGCEIHCDRKHMHVYSITGRIYITGSKATVMIAAFLPYLHFQREEAEYALKVGYDASRKPAVAQKMAALGWALPEGWA